MRPTRLRFRNRWVVLAGATVLAVTAPAAAQTMSSGGAGSSFGGSSSGGSGTGSTGTATAALGFAAGTMAGSTSSIGGVTPTTSGGRGGSTGRGGTSNGTSPGVSSSNLFYGYYANPLAAGLVGSTGTANGAGTVSAPFGTTLYSTLYSTTGTTGTTGTRGGAGGTATVSSGMNLPGPQSTSRRMPTYSSTVRFRYTAPTPEQRRTDLQTILGRTSSLPGAAGIQVTMDGPVVVLRGQVADDDARRLAENVLRLSPGVHAVRNELEVK